jgi:hypothetical protein
MLVMSMGHNMVAATTTIETIFEGASLLISAEVAHCSTKNHL